jgi:hypothetical protein
MGQTGNLNTYNPQPLNTQYMHVSELDSIRNRSSTQHQMLYLSEIKKSEVFAMERGFWQRQEF